MSLDYDSPWKEALDAYFEPFVALVFPQIHRQIDWTRGYESLDKEFQQVVREAEIQIEIHHPKLRLELLGNDNGTPSDHDTIKLSAPFLIRRRGSEVRLVLENGEPSEAKPIPSLTKAIAWSRHWADQIVSGKLVTMDDLAKSAGVSKIHARRMLRCAALSPALTGQILDGRQPVDLTFDRLTRNLPLSWEEQHLS